MPRTGSICDSRRQALPGAQTYEPRARASWNLAASVRQGIDYGTWSSRWATRPRTRPMAGNLVAKVHAECRAEAGDLYAATLVAHGWPTPGSG